MSYVAQVFGPTLYIERTVAKLLNIRIFNGFDRSWIRLKPLKTQNDQSRTVHFCHVSQSINPTNSFRNSVEMECFVKWLTTEQTDPSTYKLRPMRWSPSNYSQSRLRNLSIPIVKLLQRWQECRHDDSTWLMRRVISALRPTHVAICQLLPYAYVYSLLVLYLFIVTE